MKKFLFLLLMVIAVSCNQLHESHTPTYEVKNFGNQQEGSLLQINFIKGESFNHPTFAIWLVDSNGKFIQTLFVTKSIANGYFPYVKRYAREWKAGEVKRPATLPYWLHQRNKLNEFGTLLPTPKKPVIDGRTGATPLNSFSYNIFTDKPLDGRYFIYLEINQTWDWNEYWTNNKYPDDFDYKTSCQPAVVYRAEINTNEVNEKKKLEPIGRSHYAGKNGKLYTDLETLTTALKIIKEVTVTLK